MRNSLGFGALVVVSSLVFACGATSTRDGFEGEGGESGPLGGGGNGEGLGGSTPDAPEPEECTKMDIVFVVDDSGSMEEEQVNLAANFPKFVAKIDSFTTASGSKLDWRAAVTTTGRTAKYTMEVNLPVPIPGAPKLPPTPVSEKGDDGAFRMTAACGTTKRWVERSDPNASTDFSCLAQVGTGGPALEMPLEATKLALNDRMADGTNAGFLREDALLAVVILTDEDDCSRDDNDFTYVATDECSTANGMKPVVDYKNMLDNVAKGSGRWATAVIAGEKSCSSSFGDAVEAKRLKEFVSLAGSNGAFSSICEGDLTQGLEKALETFDTACKALPPPVK